MKEGQWRVKGVRVESERGAVESERCEGGE